MGGKESGAATGRVATLVAMELKEKDSFFFCLVGLHWSQREEDLAQPGGGGGQKDEGPGGGGGVGTPAGRGGGSFRLLPGGQP